jgi:hypothetical protein
MKKIVVLNSFLWALSQLHVVGLCNPKIFTKGLRAAYWIKLDSCQNQMSKSGSEGSGCIRGMEKIFALPVMFMTAVVVRVPPRKEHLQGPLGAYTVKKKLLTHLEVCFTSAGTAIIVEKFIASWYILPIFSIMILSFSMMSKILSMIFFMNGESLRQHGENNCHFVAIIFPWMEKIYVILKK